MSSATTGRPYDRSWYGIRLPGTYAFVAPGLLALLASSQTRFRDARPWIDARYHQDTLPQGGSGEQRTQLAATSAARVTLPLVVAVITLLRSEVK